LTSVVSDSNPSATLASDGIATSMALIASPSLLYTNTSTTSARRLLASTSYN